MGGPVDKFFQKPMPKQDFESWVGPGLGLCQYSWMVGWKETKKCLDNKNSSSKVFRQNSAK